MTEPRRSEVPSPSRERVRERVKPRRPHAAHAALTSRQRPKRPSLTAACFVMLCIANEEPPKRASEAVTLSLHRAGVARTVLAVAAVAALAVVLAACGGEPEPTPTSAPTAAPAATPTIAPTPTPAAPPTATPTPAPAFDPGPVILPTTVAAIPTPMPTPAPSDSLDATLDDVQLRASRLREPLRLSGRRPRVHRSGRAARETQRQPGRKQGGHSPGRRHIHDTRHTRRRDRPFRAAGQPVLRLGARLLRQRRGQDIRRGQRR